MKITEVFTKSTLVYIGKCVTGTSLIFFLSYLFKYPAISWCLISLLLVLSPDNKEAMKLAMNRIKANLVGVSVAGVSLLLTNNNVFLMCGALTVTIILCYLCNLITPMRSALAATVIILLHEGGKHVWVAPLERVLQVLTGCLLALIITYVFHVRGDNSKVLDVISDAHE
jgi:uncharacterized membrane protein YgaE (UPF0421/DUF939 family)